MLKIAVSMIDKCYEYGLTFVLLILYTNSIRQSLAVYMEIGSKPEPKS
jgi:hypothetical protein